MQQKTSNKPIVLFPPKVEISKRTDRFDLCIDVSWGEFSKHIKITKEAGGLADRMVDAINTALLEGSETKPYTQ